MHSMAVAPQRFRLKSWIRYFLIFALLLVVFFLVFINRFIEPILRDRLHTLIVAGSDSLYNYKLEKLTTNFFGGNVEVENLHIEIDSARYIKMHQQNALPSLTMQLDLQKGKIKGLGVFSLIFQKKIKIAHIISTEANIRLSRHLKKGEEKTTPLWKAIQPKIKSISIGRVHLDGVKLLYRNADTSEAIKLQFDRCVGSFEHVQIDSAASADTNRLVFAKEVSLQFYDLKFRTPDSTYKMKAEIIHYSSSDRILHIKDFKLQPTLEGNDFFKYAAMQKNRYVLLFENVSFTNLRLDRFIHNNIIHADSVIVDRPQLDIANDKTLPPDLASKIGKYPHERLLKANATIMIKAIKVVDAKVSYVEKAQQTQKEGRLSFYGLNALFTNVTNHPGWIRNNARCVATVYAKALNTIPLQTRFVFYLDSTEGEFDMQGQIGYMNAAQLNNLSNPLANIEIKSLAIRSLNFQIHGDGFSARANVQMKYNNLALIFKKTDEETGSIKTKKFLTKIINKFAIYPSNPENGIERVATNVTYARISSKSFFGVVWKTVFYGMQDIIFKTGRYP